MSNKQSIKQRQSESGVTGEYSPNIEFIEPIAENIIEHFDHTHGTITENDAVVMICQTNLGTTVNGKTGCMNTKVLSKGCHHNLVDMFSHVFKDNEYLMSAAAEALMKACI